jgi:hypothetical protein
MFFSIDTPDKDLIVKNKKIIEFLEVIIPWETVRDALPVVSRLREETGVPIYVANIESSVHRKRKEGKFSHYISHGFHMSNTESLGEILPDLDSIDGCVFQVNQNDLPLDSIRMISDCSNKKGFKALANVWLAPEDPAIYLTDENNAANRAAEAIIAAYAYPNVRVFLDTFVDHDRGYFPRIGLYDRRINPRKGGKVVKNLQAALTRYGSEISVTQIQDDDPRTIMFASKEKSYQLTLPLKGGTFTAQQGSTVIDLVSGEINPRKPLPENQTLEIFGK